MKERPLSASSIKTFLQCALKYYYRYEDKKPRMESTEALAFGIAVHEALEFMQKRVLETGKAPDPQDYEDTLSVFARSAAENKLDNLALYQEGRDMVINRLDNVDPEEKVLELEEKFVLETPNGTPFTGSIDKLIELDEDTIVVIDYKTSRTALSQEEADTDIQLSMYDLAVSMMYPQYSTVVCVLDYLRLSEVVTHRTPEQRQVFTEFLDAVYDEICSLEKAEINPKLNEFCPWCSFKNFCPKYKSLIEDPDLLLPPIGEMGDDDFVGSWEMVSSARRIVDRYYREFKSEAYERMKDQETIKGEDKEIYKTQQSRINYDAGTIFNIVGPDAYVRMSNVNKSAVDKFLRDNPEYADEIKNSASFSFNSPFFKTRKVKNENS